LFEDPTKASISQAILAHEAIVTCVHFLNDGVIVSGDESGNIVFTTFEEDEARDSFGIEASADSNFQWKSQPKQRTHDKAVSFLTNHEGTLVSGGSDGCVKIWRWSTDNCKLFLSASRSQAPG
jgi:WD40 repeat protein